MEENPELIEELAEAIIVPPDGGWGWVVVMGSFFCNLIVDGVIFTAGAGFQAEWEEYYGVNSGTAAWAVSLVSGLYLCVGPIVSVLANIFGSRKVVIVGTLLAASGFALSMFAPSITMLYITFGMIGGIGFGFIFMPSVVIVSHYFHRRRALATGIAVCGSGIGTFVFAPLITYLKREYSWQAILLIITGITLNCLVFGCLYRELEPPKAMLEKLEDRYAEEQKLYSNEDLSHYDHDGSPSEEDLPGGFTKRRYVPNIRSVEEIVPRNGDVQPIYTEHEHENIGRVRSDTPRYLKKVSQHSATFTDELGRRRHYSLFSINEASQEGLLRGVSKESIKRLNRPLARDDVFYTGSVSHLPQFNSQKSDVSKYVASITNIDQVITSEEEEGGLSALKSSFKQTLMTLLDVSLFKSPTFVVLSFSGFLTLTGFFVPFIYLPRYAMSIGHSPEKATFLVSVLGITNIFARIFCGWLSDHPRMNALMINNVALAIGGLFTILVPHFTPYWLLCIYCIIFGFSTACFASLRSVICVDLLGLDRLNNAFGLMLLFLGIASLIGSPVAGILYDATGNYRLSFYVTGSAVLLSGIVGFPLERLNKWERNKYDNGKYEADRVEMVPVAVIPEEDEDIDTNLTVN